MSFSSSSTTIQDTPPKGEKRRENLEAIVTPNSCYHVQSWYPLIQKDTFDTKFFTLTYEHAKAIVTYAGLTHSSTSTTVHSHLRRKQTAGSSLAVGPEQPDYANYRFGRRWVKKNAVEEEAKYVLFEKENC